MLKRLYFFLFLIFLLCFMVPAVSAETAEDITALAEFRVKWREVDLPNLTDGNYQTEWRSRDKEKADFEIMLPDHQPCYGLYALIGSEMEYLVVEREEDGRWFPSFP